ncbi:putative quinol monooxygenase [Streptomyces sp. NPDC051217]|uniref:putative quinol monooxygenase n=1 Tax=Streptomyces sp. NPDC051217 TaxID=3365644 RepID=UPI0037AA77A0
MLLTVIKFTVRPEQSTAWDALRKDFAEATRAEEGNILFEWFKSLTDPHQYLLIEGYAGPEAAQAHTSSEHFGKAMAVMPDLLTSTPEIISDQIAQDGWTTLDAGAADRSV